MNEEMQRHVELQTERRIKDGMHPADARCAALREFGNVAVIQEECRDQRGWMWLENIWRDVHFSFRSLRRSPGFSVAVIITLALCIGANSTIFSVLYGLILKPLPFHDAGQLVEVYNSLLKGGQPKRMNSVVQYVDYKANADLFTGFALWRAWTFNIGEESDPDRGIGARVTADYFVLLGMQPLLGRFYTMEECAPGRDHVLVLTQSFWEKTYHADPSAIGREIRLSGELFTIIGVAPRSLESFNTDTVLLKPFEWQPEQANPQSRLSAMATMYARVKTGVALTAARVQLATLEKRFHDNVADHATRDYLDRGGYQIALGQVRAEQTKSVRTGLLLLQGGALFVLLLGCVNVANLMLARANSRQTELAVRQALGGGRVALARQLLVEGVLLAVSGAALGLALTWTSLRVINTYTTSIVREVQPVGLDASILTSTLLISLAVALMIGLLPVLRIWRLNLLEAMRSGARGTTGSGNIRSISSLLVTAQVALALVLLVGAGLLMRSFAKVMAINPGFDATRIVHGRVAFNTAYMNPTSTQAVLDQVITKMREIPGAESVSYSSHMPVAGGFPLATIPIRGTVQGKDDTFPVGRWIAVSPDFFKTMGIRLIEGRGFTEADGLPHARPAFVVDRRFAERYFPGRSAIGEMMGTPNPGQKQEEIPVIVGVVENARLNGLEDQGGQPFIYALADGGGGGFSIEIRTMRPFAEMIASMRTKLRSVDPTLPLYQTCTLQMNLDWAAADRRGMLWLLGAFAGVALLLSAVGIYGMLAYDVTQRTKEIGIRSAIGATRGQIVAMILTQGLWKTGAGLVLGLGAALFLSRYMRSLLFEVPPTDPLAFAGVSLLLLIVALIACWLPARRAAKVDPVIALRAE